MRNGRHQIWKRNPQTAVKFLARVHGVIGVCEMLLRKLRGIEAKLNIPDDVRIPRIPNGQLKAEHILTYLKDLW